MKSWSVPDVPEVPGNGLPLRLYDSSTRELRPTAPGPTARMYVCGITPYDATHMGHAFTYVTFDLVNRVWRDAGYDVHYVQNVTDIDDPLLERANALGEDWTEIAARETDLFRADMTALNVLPPRDFVGAVESIPSVTEHIQTLKGAGAVYQVDGDLYFRTSSDPFFGDVANLDRDTMIATFAERGGDPDRPGKEDPLDSLLWRAEREGEPSWQSPLGPGRPGWHIECAVIATDALGMGIDVQGGGSDLVFPHHEMSSSQAEVLTGRRPFARHYVHSAMVGWQGHKMSKSRGNLVLVSKLRHDGVDPMAIRLALLAHHYRDDWDWTDAGLAEATERLDRWRRAVSAPAGPSADATIARMREVLSDNLNAPSALSAVDEWVERQLKGAPGRPSGEGGTDAGAPAAIRTAVDALLGVRL